MSENYPDLQSAMKAIEKIDFSNLNMPSIPNIDYNMHIPTISYEMEETMKNVQQINKEKHQREVENNQSLKSILEHNEKISEYNKELVSLNNKILNKINSLDDTLLLFNKAFDNTSQKTESELQNNNALLLQLITIIESKDDKKLLDFMGGMTGTVGIELIVSYFKMKLGLTV
ncbi:hypothetical protein [Clostridium sp. VAP51]|uniref:hypothetical protein n=1 Tax=Clostridium sp. VAP51 TaxID=2949978 RepID=UPI00207A9F09|nr:hypothetical protein [Clostridium sp. VAP51]